MATQLATVTQNAMSDAATALLDGGTAAGTIKVYDGTQPANANTAVTTQNLLCTFTLSATAFGASANGVCTLSGTPLSTTGSVAGTATWFRAESGGTGGAGTVFDGAVSTSGAQLNLNTTTISVGVNVQITSGSFTMPAA